MAAATMRDVADRAGVSKSTVSHVLNGTRFVEPETEGRVREAIRELGYRPNLLARSFRRRETRTIGLMTPNIANPYWAELASVVERTGYAEGYAVLLGNSNWSVDQACAYIQLLLAKQIDGIVLSSPIPPITVIDEILAADVPLVLVDHIVEGRSVSVVQVDNHRGGYLAGEYLLRLGHQRVGCIGPPAGSGEACWRVTGFRQAFADTGIALHDGMYVDGDFEYQSGELGVQILLERQPDLTAVFAANDHMALGVIKGLHRARRRVPKDVSVIGFDNISYTTAIIPELTTIAQPIAEIGQTIIRLLLRQIHDPASAPEVVVLEPTLIERESCRTVAPP
jgi:LacI family transcriptional regulator, galactose operon repressor